jgi:hypothetical protein
MGYGGHGGYGGYGRSGMGMGMPLGLGMMGGLGTGMLLGMFHFITLSPSATRRRDKADEQVVQWEADLEEGSVEIAAAGEEVSSMLIRLMYYAVSVVLGIS